MPFSDDEPTADRASLLEEIYASGDAYRRRRLRAWGVAGVAAVVVLAAVPVMALRGDDDPQVAASGEGSSTSAIESSSTLCLADRAPAPGETVHCEQPSDGSSTTDGGDPGDTPVSDPASSVISDPGPPTTIPCRNSYDPACGDFYWDPEPGPNQPATATVTGTSLATPGRFRFTVTWRDPDSPAAPICPTLTFGDGTSADIPCPEIACAEHPPGYGAWTPPEREAGERTWTYEHTYAAPGTYQVTWSGEAEECGPYGSDAAGSTTVVILE